MNNRRGFLRRLLRAYCDGLRMAGYPETYAGAYLTHTAAPLKFDVPDSHLRFVELPPRARLRLG